MRIGVDATCWPNRRGYGRFARSLLTAALALDRANEYVFYIDDDSAEFPLPAGVEVVHVATGVPTTKAATAHGRRSLGDMWAISRTISKAKLDLVFFPSVYSYVPLTGSTPQLVTIHDVIPELFPELVFPTWRSKLFWGLKVKLACARARLILTVSEYSRRRLAEKLRIPQSRMRVIPEAGDPLLEPPALVDGAALRARWKLPADARLLMYVGGFSPHKNLGMLVDIYDELRQQPRFSSLYLLLVGDYQGDVFFSCYGELVAQVERLGLRDRVLFTGHVPDADLSQLLHSADVLALPSFCEGFGLPAVEAAACGTPSVVTTESPLAEILGEAAIAVAPGDRAGWTSALTAVLADEPRRAAMKTAARAAAARLSWQHSARALLAIFDEVRPSHAATD
jgi:glycosyltransferase involved in cell wall biosynthesis